MFLAQQLKKENICEYLLYMWQVEDIIRACNWDMTEIEEKVILRIPDLSEQQKKEAYEWYDSLLDMMRREDVKEKGHLQINKNVIIALNDLHYRLLKSTSANEYKAKYQSVNQIIRQLRQQHPSPDTSDIELCFDFQYGILLLRMKKRELSPVTANAQAEISDYMRLLNKQYFEDTEEPVE